MLKDMAVLEEVPLFVGGNQRGLKQAIAQVSGFEDPLEEKLEQISHMVEAEIEYGQITGDDEYEPTTKHGVVQREFHDHIQSRREKYQRNSTRLRVAAWATAVGVWVITGLVTKYFVDELGVSLSKLHQTEGQSLVEPSGPSLLLAQGIDK